MKKVKNKFYNQLQIFKYITSTDKFKIVFMCLVLISLYGSIVLGAGQRDVINSMYITFIMPQFNICLFTILFINTFNVCSTFDKYFDFYIIRLKNKKNYIKEMLKNVIFLNVVCLILFFLIYISILYFLKSGKVEIYTYINYSINTLSYLGFFLVRYICIILIISMLQMLLYINFKSKITMLIGLFFLSGFIIYEQSSFYSSSFTLNIWRYFNLIYYSSFGQEVCYSVLFILILEIILFITYLLTTNNKKIDIF